MTRHAILRCLEGFLAARAAGDDIVAAYLFGSVARGDDGAGSDVDVAVLHRRDPPPTFEALPLRLEGDIERLLGRRAEVVALNLAPVDLCVRVLRDGVVILDRDRPARIAFEVRTRNAWFDLQPVLRTYRRIASPR
ncbi:MAG: nucleotidyltransferase domain-containing protein [Acidobacteria bacterium]|nr:nucleotidyltransferase domain-containing protein [Acidobacteriota bacterium]